MPYISQSSLCWDCANSTKGGCSWSAEFKPVEGWVAKPMKKETQYGDGKSYLVYSCPLFDRDAFGGGTKRLTDPLYQDFLKENNKSENKANRQQNYFASIACCNRNSN